MKRTIWTLVVLSLIGVFIFSGYRYLTLSMAEQHNTTIMANAKKLYQPQKKAATTSSKTSQTAKVATQVATDRSELYATQGEYRKSFADLVAVNADITGWLTIADTTIDYPILQSQDNTYYLTHNYQKETFSAGSIFKDYRNTNEFTDQNTIIYGHSTLDQSMFGELSEYTDADFYAQHPTFDYDTLLTSYTVQVMAVYQTTTTDNYIQPNFATTASYAAFIAKTKQKSQYDTGVDVSTTDRLLTLSTCASAYTTNKRLVVVGKLVAK
jgi:sortase B